jgi:hypothetical protein
MARVDDGGVGKLGQPAQGLPEVGSALARLDRKVGPPRRPRTASRRSGELAADDEGAVLRPVPRRVHHADLDRSDASDLAVLEAVERKLGLGERMDRDGHAVFEREAAVAETWSAWVCVSSTRTITHPSSPAVEVLLDREGRIDGDCDAGRGSPTR